MAGVKCATVLPGLSLDKKPGSSKGPIMHVGDRDQPGVSFLLYTT